MQAATWPCLGTKTEILVIWESVSVGSHAGDDKSRARCSLSLLGLIHTSFREVWEFDTGSCSACSFYLGLRKLCSQYRTQNQVTEKVLRSPPSHDRCMKYPGLKNTPMNKHVDTLSLLNGVSPPHSPSH